MRSVAFAASVCVFVAWMDSDIVFATEPAPPVSAANARPLFRDFMGINGHTVQFKPELYRPICRLVRDYHPLDWDTGPDSDYKLDFPFARNRVSWEQVYGSWKKFGWVTDACIMFETLPPGRWVDLSKDANRYGQQFAKHFGPSSALAVVESAEIGNEPGKYSDEAYRLVFESMAKGLREGDPKLKIVTCNVNVGKSGDYHKSVDCVVGLESLYDILNVHSYAMLKEWPTWQRSFPEDPNLEKFTQDIDDLIRWRDEHAPGKEVWVTEFGWDSSTKLPPAEGDFAKWQGNSDIEQAQWLVRSFFSFATRDIDRAYIYFFNDDDAPQLHGASGLTRRFEPKPSYYAVSHLYRTLGDYRFSRVVHEVVGEASVFEFAHESEAAKVVWAAWSPTGSGHRAAVHIEADGMTLVSAEMMPLTKNDSTAAKIAMVDGKLKIDLHETPAFIFLER